MTTLAAVAYLVAYAIAIGSAMFAIERRVRWPYFVPFVFGGVVTAAISSSEGLRFDAIFFVLFAGSTALLGWATARFQLSRGK